MFCCPDPDAAPDQGPDPDPAPDLAPDPAPDFLQNEPLNFITRISSVPH